MTEDSKENELESQTANPMKTPGVMLREARREKKLTQEEVAKQLHLSVQWIKDLESNNYSRGAALIYVRGYLRAYARLMGLLPDEVMSAFESFGLEEAYTRDHAEVKVIKHQAVPIISKSTRVLMSRRAVRWVTASAFVLLVVSVGIWWQGQKRHGVDHSSPVVMQQPKQELPIQATTAPTLDNNDNAVIQKEDNQKEDNKALTDNPIVSTDSSTKSENKPKPKPHLKNIRNKSSTDVGLPAPTL